MSDRMPTAKEVRQDKYIPTPEEVRGNSWNYCYGVDAPILPPVAQEPPDEHHQ